MRAPALAIAALIALAAAATAQEPPATAQEAPVPPEPPATSPEPPKVAEEPAVVGRGAVDGRQVDLLEDGTWRYSATGRQPCIPVTTEVFFCGSLSAWRPFPPRGTGAAALFRYDDRHYGMFLVDNVGGAGGVTLDDAQASVLRAVADAARATPEQIPVMSVTATEVDGVPARTIIYGARLNNLPLVYANTLIVSDDVTLQIATYAIGTEYTSLHAQLHADFLSSVRLSFDGGAVP